MSKRRNVPPKVVATPEITAAELKKRIHLLTNCTQAVLGYMELEQYEKAQAQIRTCIGEMRALAKIVARLKRVVVQPPHADMNN